MKNDIAVEEVRRLFDYNPITGIMTRRVRTYSRNKIGDAVGFTCEWGHLRVRVNGMSCYVHRLIWAWVYGIYPKEQMDHINGNPTDNRLVNLRAATQSTNMRNRRISKNNTSGFHGVYWDKVKNTWRVQIQVDGKHKYLGRHKELDDAVRARKQAEVKYGYHENHGRVVA